jgi:hypothetical protein
VTYQKWLFLALLALLVMACVEIRVNFKSKEYIIGYVAQEMIRARDSSRYLDTVGVIYRKGDSILIKNKPGIYDFKLLNRPF